MDQAKRTAYVVSTHSRLKAAGAISRFLHWASLVSTHSRLKAAGIAACRLGGFLFVSTHSRLKAAGTVFKIFAFGEHGFNTQPPKGGWQNRHRSARILRCFNTQPPKGGWT